MRKTLLALCVLSITPSVSALGTFHVDANSTTGANDGSSWANAFQGSDGLQLAMSAATSGDRIFVAQGTYLPSETLNRTHTFNLIDGVELYGGFVGTEDYPAQRPPMGTANSVLSGDLAGNDGPGGAGMNENSYHILRGSDPGDSAVLDGFVVASGYASGGGNNGMGAGLFLIEGVGVTVRNCEFINNRADSRGAGILLWGEASLRIEDCVFDGNTAGGRGGGICAVDSVDVTIDRCLFTRCSATSGGGVSIKADTASIGNCIVERCSASSGTGGGGIFSYQSVIRIFNCTVYSNVSTGDPVAGMRINVAFPDVDNCIVWGNVGPGGAQDSINQIDILNDVEYSIVMGGYSGVGNLSVDPLFVDAANGNFALQAASPGIDAGNSGAVPAGNMEDIFGAPRFTDTLGVADTGAGVAPMVDLGAIEDQPAIVQELCFGDGTGASCPCDEFGLAGNGCSSGAFADGCRLALAGTPSVSNDSLTFITTHSTPTAPGLLFEGDMVLGGGVGNPVGNGILCFPSQKRWSVQFGDLDGTVSYGPNLLGSSASAVPGATLFYQWWYRDPSGVCGAGFNFSSAYSVVWLP